MTAKRIRLLLAAGLAAATTAPASAASFVDKRTNACTPGCGYGIVVKYWHKKGSAQRGVGWVYTSKSSTTKGHTYYARWLYQKPGKPMKAATSWTKGRTVGDFNEVSWGRDGHTGPQFPRNTKVCIQYKGAAKLCRTLG